jgi:hypothetical protein
MEESPEAGIQTPKLSDDIAEGEELGLRSTEKKEFSVHKRKQCSLRDFVVDLDTLSVIFLIDESNTRAILMVAEDLENHVKDIEGMTKEYVEIYQNIPANEVNVGGSDASESALVTSTLPYSQHSTKLLDRNNIATKLFWALGELGHIVEYIKSTMDSSLEKLKIATEYSRFIKFIRQHLERTESYHHDSIRIQALINQMGDTTKERVIKSFEVCDTLMRIPEKLLAIATQIGLQAFKGTDADISLADRQLSKNNTGKDTINVDTEIGATETGISRPTDPILGIPTQIKATVDKTVVNRCHDAIITTLEHTDKAFEIRNPAYEGFASTDNGSDKNVTVPQRNECGKNKTIQKDKGEDDNDTVSGDKGPDDKGTLTGERGADDNETIPGEKEANDKGAVTEDKGADDNNAVPGVKGTDDKRVATGDKGAYDIEIVLEDMEYEGKGTVKGNNESDDNKTFPGDKGTDDKRTATGKMGVVDNETVPIDKECDGKGTVKGANGADDNETVPGDKGTGDKGTATGEERADDNETVPGDRRAADKGTVIGDEGADDNKTVPRYKGADKGTVIGDKGSDDSKTVPGDKGTDDKGRIPGVMGTDDKETVTRD